MKKLVILLLGLSILLASCSSGTPVATVGDTEISEGEFMGYLASVKSQMKDTELQTDEDWETNEIEGKKAIDVAKQTALDNAITNALYIETAKASGIKLSAEDKETIKNIKERVISGYGGKEAYKEYLKETGTTDEFFDRICEGEVYRSKIQESITFQPTEEELVKYFTENDAEISEVYRKAKHILILTKDPQTGIEKTPEEKTTASNLAKEILTRVQNGEDFDALMHQYSEDTGLSTHPDGYVFTRGEMVPEFEQAVFGANVGDVVFCISDYGFHIVKRLPLEYTDIKNFVRTSMLSSLVEKKVEELKNQYGITVEKNEDVLKEIK